MCGDVETVKAALAMGLPASSSCCEGKDPNGQTVRCPFFATCSYQRQKTSRPDVWIVAHAMLFQAQAALGKVDLVVIDEGFWQAGLRIPKRGLTLDEIGAGVPIGPAREDAARNELDELRGRLARALRAQDGAGGVAKRTLVAGGLSADDCTRAISLEWRLKGKVPVYPGMPKDSRRRALAAAGEAKHVRARAAVWAASRAILRAEEAEFTSGHLYLEARDGEEGRVTLVKARGVRSIASSWKSTPVLCLDATLPEVGILQAFFPQIHVATKIEAALPAAVTVRQVLGSPTSAKKLAFGEDGKAGRNLQAIRREVLRRHLAVGRGTTLVVAQLAVATWLKSTKLPPGVHVEHFNNVSGLDLYRDVRLLITVGRTLPSPAATEAMAAALTGREPTKVAPWYHKATRGIRLRDGSGRAVECDAHPDVLAEACRWQVCEAELVQAIGRGRGVNRTAAMPLDIDILADVVVPLPVDVVEAWAEPGEEWEMAADGVVLCRPADVSAAWPDVWGTPKAAERWLAKARAEEPSTPPNPYIKSLSIGFRGSARCFRYQRAGLGQKWWQGACDPTVVPDLRGWLEARLGPLAALEVGEEGQEGQRQAAE